jgi:hypothetical protein
MGPEAFEFRTVRRASLDLQCLYRCRPALWSMAMLDNFVTMDKTMMCNHTPETKKQSMHCQPGPVLAKVHYSRTKLMLLVFFESKGLMYSNIVPKGSAVNRTYIVKALGLSEAVEKKEACVVELEVVPSGQCSGKYDHCGLPPTTSSSLNISLCRTWLRQIFSGSEGSRRSLLAVPWTRGPLR